MTRWGLFLTASYLLGSVPFSYWIGHWFKGVDIRTVGSHNPGATNVLRVAGRLPGSLALVLDAGKGALPVLLGRAWGLPHAAVAAAAAAAVLGHVFSPFLGFHGGKGVATGAGALGALAPLPTALAAATFVVVVACTRLVALGSVAAAALVPLLVAGAMAVGRMPPGTIWTAAAAAAISALVIVRHRENIARLRAGTEDRLGEWREDAE